ncbi:sulfatase [Streptomyces sp. NPDC059740]|uniref:sulfatase n=1 Tax=Streptomyces sp. NPDC059740 TaxID=3346926 RepID=UPI003660E7A2
MRAVMVMFDSLNRRLLPPYGCDWVHAPNFERLAARSAVFDNCYGGSMPCMPARREMHTARPNFLHRSWGPLEPYDDSVPQILGENGVHTHLVTDHQHYWEDGGATYHQRYDSFEFFRGQEGDKWKGQVADPEIPESLGWRGGRLWRQDWINRSHLTDPADHPQTRTFDAGLEFLATNHTEDRWFLQIECFDPHEPFFSYADHKKHYAHDWQGPHFDWPDYKRVTEDEAAVDHARREYAALLTMCDASLGRVLDAFDAHGLWEDTLLVVCTDHGFLLGEHGWWGKNVQPWFDENIHTPLFVWDPRSRATGRRASLVQTIDIGPTLLDFFGLDRTPDMLGVPLTDTVATDRPVREAGLFGSFGAHVNITDGRHVYMRACAGPENRPLYEHTLMPTHMASRFTPEELREATLSEPFDFTKGVPLLRVPGFAVGNPYHLGTRLYDLATDPDQEHPLLDEELELRMATLLVEQMRALDAPADQFARLGLPASGPVTAEHLLTRSQLPQVQGADRPLPLAGDFPPATASPAGVSVATPLRDLLAVPGGREALARHLPHVLHPGMLAMTGALSPLQLAAVSPAVTPELLHALAAALTAGPTAAEATTGG